MECPCAEIHRTDCYDWFAESDCSPRLDEATALRGSLFLIFGPKCEEVRTPDIFKVDEPVQHPIVSIGFILLFCHVEPPRGELDLFPFFPES